MPYLVELTVALERASGGVLQEKPLVQYHLDSVRKYFFDIRDIVKEIEISSIMNHSDIVLDTPIVQEPIESRILIKHKVVRRYVVSNIIPVNGKSRIRII